jgi:predicted ATP-dependent serine protease
MSYSVEAVKAPTLGRRVKMLCEESLSDSMKDFPVLEQYFNRSSATLIVGGMGSGKSSLLLQMLTSFWRKVYQFIYVVAPARSLASIKKSFLRVLPDDQFFDGLTVEVAEDITARLPENSKHGRKSLVIFDDAQAK